MCEKSREFLLHLLHLRDLDQLKYIDDEYVNLFILLVDLCVWSELFLTAKPFPTFFTSFKWIQCVAACVSSTGTHYAVLGNIYCKQNLLSQCDVYNKSTEID